MNYRLRKFFSYYKPYLRLFVSIMVCAFAVAAITLAFPLCTRYITKNILTDSHTLVLSRIYWAGALMVVLTVLQAACNYHVDYRGHAMGAMMESSMRKELFDHCQKLSFAFYDKQRVGQLMSRITNDLLLLAEFYHHAPEDYLVYTVKFVGTFIILLNIDVRLTFTMFAFLPFMAVFTLYFNKVMNKALARNKSRIGDINAQVEDSLSGIRVVKSFANEEVEMAKFAAANDRFLDSRKNTYKNEAYLYNGMNALTQLLTVSVVVFGGVSIANSSLDLADLITYLLYIGYLVEPIQKLNHVTMQYQEGVTGFQRFMEILEIGPDIRDSQDALELTDVQGNIRFENVGFKYDGNLGYVLKDISLDIKAGEYIALVGSSGVGKTTLCSLIPRFYEATEGEVMLDSVNIREISLSSLRRSIGIVQQDLYLFAGTVMENIRYGKCDATIEEVVEAAKMANAHDFIMELPDGYNTDIGQRGVKLSGGQKQRLGIARVFLKNPPVLIFDEATSALDTDSERAVQDSLESLAANRTTIVIAHRLSTIRNAERIVVLTDRGIDEQGTHDELMAMGGTYARLYAGLAGS